MASSAGRSPVSFWLCAAGLAVIALAIYVPTLSYGFTYLDDNNLILNQRHFLEKPSNLFAVFGRTYFPSALDTYYRPMINLSIGLNWQLGQAHPLGYHALNAGFHALACILVYSLLIELGQKGLPAWLATLLFAVHPVQVSSVAWIPGRNDTLLTCFALGACLMILRSPNGIVLKIGHVLCFVAALLSKETAVCLPLIFLVAYSGARGAGSWRALRPMWMSWAVCLGLYLAARVAIIAAPPGYMSERFHAAVWHFPLLVADMGKLAFPWRLQVLATPEDVLVWPGAVVVAAVALFSLLLRGMRLHLVVLSVTMILAPLLMCLPATKSVVLDNRLYLPMVGWTLLVSEFLRVLMSERRAFIPAVGVTGITLLLLGYSTLRYCHNFENATVFSQAALEASPNSAIARHLRFRSFYPAQMSGMFEPPASP